MSLIKQDWKKIVWIILGGKQLTRFGLSFFCFMAISAIYFDQLGAGFDIGALLLFIK